MPAYLDAQWEEAALCYAAQLARARARVDEGCVGWESTTLPASCYATPLPCHGYVIDIHSVEEQDLSKWLQPGRHLTAIKCATIEIAINAKNPAYSFLSKLAFIRFATPTPNAGNNKAPGNITATSNEST